MPTSNKIVVVIPAYNAAKTIRKTVMEISRMLIDEIVVVNDGSTDGTDSVLQTLDVICVSHNNNRGYGASQKTGYRTALARGADIVIMVHADYQHDPAYIADFLSYLSNHSVDIILGSRVRNGIDALRHGMPLYKIIPNRLLTYIENVVLELHLADYHTGYRLFTRKALETIPFERFSDDYVYDQHIIFSARAHQLTIGEIPTSCIYHKDATVVNIATSLRYGIGILLCALTYIFKRESFL